MAVVSLGIFIVAVNTTASEDAVVSFVIEGLASPEVTGWLHYTYLLALAPLLVIAGRLGDVFGKEHLYAYGFGLLAIGSVLFGLAPRFSWLVAFRAVQAVGAAAVLSLGIALLVEAFPRPERGSALGVAVSVGLVGSVLGSLLVDGLGWTWVSFGTVPIALVGILACRRFILANPPSDEQRFDLAGAILLAASMVCLILGLGLGLQNGYTDSWVMLLLTLSVLVFTNFVWIESRVDHPLLDLAMFKNLDFSVGLLTGFIVGVALTAASGFGISFLFVGLGNDIAQMDRIALMAGATSAAAALLAGRASDRKGPRLIALSGLAIVALGYLLAQTLRPDSQTSLVTLGAIMVGAGTGLFLSANYTTVMAWVGSERLGVAGGMLGLSTVIAVAIATGPVLRFGIARQSARATVEANVESFVGAFRDMALVGSVLTVIAMLLVWRFYGTRPTGRSAE